MTKKHTMSDYVWAISGLTHLIGDQFVCGDTQGYECAWADDEDYWFWLEFDPIKEQLTAQIADSRNTKAMYAAIGYCQYHKIPHAGVGERSAEVPQNWREKMGVA